MSFLESDDVGLLFVEVDGLVHPTLKGSRDFCHEVDYSGDLDV